MLCRIVLIVAGSVDPHCRVSHYDGFVDYDAGAAFDDVSWTDWSSSNPQINDIVRPTSALADLTRPVAVRFSLWRAVCVCVRM